MLFFFFKFKKCLASVAIQNQHFNNQNTGWKKFTYFALASASSYALLDTSSSPPIKCLKELSKETEWLKQSSNSGTQGNLINDKLKQSEDI